MHNPDDNKVSFSRVMRLLDDLDRRFASNERFSLEEVAREHSLTLDNSAVFEELIAHHYRRMQEREPELSEETYLSHFDAQSFWYDVAESACTSSSVYQSESSSSNSTDLGTGEEDALATGGVPEFAGGPLSTLSVAMQRKLRERMELVTIPDKTRIFSEGEVGDCLLVIQSGTVLVTSRNPDRDTEILGVITSGQVVGEMALMGVDQRTADATAKGEVVALKLTAADFQQLCRKHLEISQIITEIIGTRLGNQRQDALFSRSLHGYEIHRRLGRGGMSIVYDAVQTKTGRRVALKMMSHRLAFDDYARAWFRSEAETVASFDHPNIPRHYDLFDAFATSFMAIEFIEGIGLDALIRRCDIIDEESVLRIASQVGHALRYAHENRIVHRDVKPGNCMIDCGGTVKLLDFGLSVPIRKSLMTEGVIVGTPSYMSPEQFEGRPAEPESDWFSLGCTVFELITGEKLLHPANVLDLGHIFENWNMDFILETIPGDADKVRELISILLDFDPGRRGRAFELLKPYYSLVDVDSLGAFG